ncbi:MAG: hypothetical protein SO096_01495 [Prevotella sp.]|jgi:cell division GTPase FtsZ|uniref:hypothetical protein n=1 Tax=Segatella bryantii TaxID=77095 RepID=UPI000894FEB4|nr:hypothetical protein [Segatella bryantii]MDY4955116.1 hypothetical protein [Prevotella sp.]UKK71986.1 hypothetical protein L6467_02480 [Segatella bryantii]SEA45450.1 FtsZ family, C-terminal domain [Segatella bryantii]
MIDNNIKSNISQGEELEELIAQLTQNGMQIKIDKNDLDYLYHANAILKRRIISFPHFSETRIDSIIREMNSYSNICYKDYNKVILYIATSSKNPLQMDEMNQIVSLISGYFTSDTECIWGMATDEKLEDKLLVIIVCSN